VGQPQNWSTHDGEEKQPCLLGIEPHSSIHFTKLSQHVKERKKIDDHGKDKKLKDSIELLLESNSGRGS
jgi:hypothetical protein